ncbi:MarR family winged helix-turn-helix transcriptional regulator [Nocardia stercoris]|uniref:MarR family transcriptional regulator n=1 Tax=Nocardia stercoris TaxID=2483361 RepID=A0A3M2KWS8_9NOCA|nr:MarR family transcriptional regulator [Nocardia stercoris]RMI28713.1 MarR family transcriptional regulator [Nocardia stercoris]
MTSSFVPLGDRPPFLLRRLGGHVGMRFKALLAPLGIEPRHFGPLRFLHAEPGSTQQQVGEALGIHRNVMVGVIDDLERAGLVERRRHPADRRAYALYPLPPATPLLAAAERVMQSLEDELLAPLDAAERDLFRDALRRISNASGVPATLLPGLADGSGAPGC